ncbi:MAG: alpha amylase C-terminal domain-containing protein [bacterium]|nr:alpha amylase C-terminal domain-containing protein [bacterium]
MNDTLSFMQTAPEYRSRDYHKLTFSMMYFYDEHFLLPFSHDEVAHGKATIVQKMNGEYADKFAQAKTLYLYMYTHPGKKLNFMGNEIGQMREWDEKKEQDWNLLKYPTHDSFAHFMKDLNHIYLKNAALYEQDYERDGFEWVDCQMESACLYAYRRKGKNQHLLVILNFSDEAKDYSFRIDQAENCELLFSTDAEKYGGKALTKIHQHGNKVEVSLAPFSSHILGFHDTIYK